MAGDARPSPDLKSRLANEHIRSELATLERFGAYGLRMRRVVVGERNGQAVIASDEQLQPITVGMIPGAGFLGIWGEDGAATMPGDGTPPPAPTWFPPPGGYRFEVVVLPPDGATPTVDPAAGLAELRAKLPGLAETLDPDHPAMHASDTVDIDVILEGEVFFRLEDGTEVQVSQGDCIVVTGQRHAWSNRSGKPCTLATASIGARRC